MATGEFVTMEGSDYTFIASDIDIEQGLHKGVFLHKNHRNGAHTEIIVAEAASLPVLNPGHSLTAEFYNGYNYLLDNRKHRDVTLEFKRLTVHLANEEAQEQYRRKAETTGTLGRSTNPKDIAEYQWRITTPLATVLLALLAVPLGRSAPRESRFRNFFIALGIYIAVFSMSSVMRTWIEQSKLGAFPGLWGTYAVVAVLLLLLVNPPRLRRSR
jgi:lipopolysaccharide export system permease protein